MKQLAFVAIMVIAAATFSACGNSTPKADLKNDVDTMSYAMGMAQSQGLKEFLVGRMQIDTTYMDEFIKGLNDGANAGDDKKTAAYYAGIQIGQQISNQMIKGINSEVYGQDSTKSISLKNFMAGFIAGTTGKNNDVKMTSEQAQQLAQTKMMAIKSKNMEKEYGPNKVAGEKWLAANKNKAGVNLRAYNIRLSRKERVQCHRILLQLLSTMKAKQSTERFSTAAISAENPSL